MIAVASGGKPGPGWYFNPGAKDWCLISKEEHANAAQLVALGYVQTSAKYRCVTLFQRGDYRKELDTKELSRAVFASFQEQGKIDQQLQQHREREARRGRAQRILRVLRAVPADVAEEFMITILCSPGSTAEEYPIGRAHGMTNDQIDGKVTQ